VKTVTNKTSAPIKITLPGGKALRLGPGKSGQIRDNASDSASVKRMVEAGTIEIRDEGAHDAGPGFTSAGPGRGSQGQGRATFRRRKSGES
jgi:hypothetical protein